LGNIRNNAKEFLALTKGRLCAVVKANAYGHGAEAVVTALGDVVDCFAVAIIEEALAIRAAACGKEILVLTPPIDEEEAYFLAVNGFTASVGDLRTANLLARVCETYRLPLNVHLKVNTGMNRYGMNAQTLGKVCKFLQCNPYVRVRGIYSHLCECSLARAEKQRALFMRMLSIGKRYFSDFIAHLGGTYAALLGEKYTFDMCRIGLGLYGYLPCAATLKTGVTVVPTLQKGMTVYAKAVTKRKMSGGSLGYGAEVQTKGFVTVCRYGYADGILRRQNNGVDGWKMQANTLCMDACIRMGEISRGQWFPILTDAEKTAAMTETIPYEVLCAATRRAEFLYDNDKITVCGSGRNTEITKRKESDASLAYEEKTR